VVSDGEGPQEETYLPGTPRLLMRGFTERLEHSNACMAGFELIIL